MSDYLSPFMFSREEMKAQAQLDNRNLRAAREKYEPEDPTYSRNQKSSLDIADNTPDKIASKWKSDTTFEIQSELIAKNAAGISDDDFGAPTKIQSEVTKEMIAEHRAKSQRPLELFGKAYAYHPSRLAVDLEEFRPMPVKINTDAEYQAGMKRKAKLAREIEADNERIRNIQAEEIPSIRARYDAKMERVNKNAGKQSEIEELNSEKLRVNQATTIDEARAIANKHKIDYKPSQKLPTLQKLILKKLDSSIKFLEKGKLKTQSQEELTAEFDKEMAMAFKEVEVLRSSIDEKNGDIYSIDDAVKDSEEANRLNEREKERIDRENNTKLAMFAANLTVLNGGIMDLSRQPDESDEDYRQRLMASGKTVYDDRTAEDDENAIQLARAKNNLSKVVSDEGKISTIANKLTADDRYQYNKIFTTINKKILDLYGFNNSLISESEIAKLIHDLISSPNFVSSAVRGQDGAEETKEPDVVASVNSSYYPASHYSKPELVAIAIATGVDEKGTKNQIYDKLKLANKLPPRGRAVDLGPALGAPAPPAPPAPVYNPDESIDLVGLGVSHERLPKIVQFGDYYISPHNLYYKNILSIRSRTGKAINGLKDMKVSDAFVSAIMKILRGDVVRKHDVSMLSEKEQMAYDNLIYMSKLFKKHHNNVDKTAQKMKERFAVLEGELEAGNTNKLIVEELHQLLHKMAKSNIITATDATNYWKGIKKML